MKAHSGYFRRKRSKKGIALSTAMAICIVLAMLVALLVSMASLNITTTQATVNQREAYIQAKSALSYVEAYYLTYGDELPGKESNGKVGEALVVFKDSNIADGATFYNTKEGLKSRRSDGTIEFAKTLIDDSVVESYKTKCPDTYVVVQNVTTASDQVLVLTAHSKYGQGQAYTLSKQFTVGATPGEQDNEFKGSILYKGEAKTRFVRFHVRATSALEGVPYFYMWYNGISPLNNDGTPQNPYVTSTVESKLTFNKKYKEVVNGNWGAGGPPTGGCAMSYEGNGWYVTEKTLNLTRNVHFVNGIVTKTGAERSISYNESDWNKQSWEFFGIPIPTESELGADLGMDIYFELNKDELHDMQKYSSTDDAFAVKYRHYASSDNGVTQLNNFVKYCSEYYTVYTKTDTAIMHYRKAGVTEDTSNPGNGFAYEGYGWYRKSTHSLGDQGPGGYYFRRFDPISSNGHGKELVYETFVVEAENGSMAQFATEEEANRWLINSGDLNAGNYIEVNVNSANQPIDPADNPAAKLSYHAWVYSHDSDVPTYKKNTTPTSTKTEEPVATDLDKSGDEPAAREVADAKYGDFYVVGNEFNNYGGDGTHQDLRSDDQVGSIRWNQLEYKLTGNGDGTFSIEVDTEPFQNLEFWVIQRPQNLTWKYNNGWWGSYYNPCENAQPNVLKITNQSTAANNLYYGNGGSISGYFNWWGDSANDYDLFMYFCESNKTRINFNASTNEIWCENIGTDDSDGEEEEDDGISDTKTYSVLGWMNEWGTSQDGESTLDGVAYYKYTRQMEMYADVDGLLTYSDGSLIVESGNTYEFMIAERDAGVSVDEAVDWTKVIDKDNNKAQTNEADKNRANTANAQIITPQPDSATGKPCKYYVTILYGPNPDKDNQIMPFARLTPIDDVETFYVVGNFNGWNTSYEGEDKKGTDQFEYARATAYQMERQTIDQNEIVYTYKINSVQEGAADPVVNYDLRVIGTASRKDTDAEGHAYPDGKSYIDYTKTWGRSVDTTRETVTDDGVTIQTPIRSSLGQDAFTYSLSARSVVTITFTYRINDPETSFIVVTQEAVQDGDVESVFVGFHNKKLTDVNDPENKNGMNSEFETPWENVYATYYTEATGFNCRIATKAEDGENWWASVPVDAESVYFSNKPTNNYDELHSIEFQFTDDITNDEFSSSESTIFFPIHAKDDPKYNEEAKKNHWTVGNSQDYFEYINHKTEAQDDVDMVYYGATQNNYYDAPFVNVLNMLASKKESGVAQPKPNNKYCFSSYPWSSFTIGGWEGGQFSNVRRGTRKVSFNKDQYVTYRGENYYYIDCSSWHGSCSFMILCNPYSGRGYNENHNYLYAYLFEDQFSLEPNGKSDGLDMTTRIARVSGGNLTADGRDWYYGRVGSSNYQGKYDSNLSNVMYMWDRAGGAFTSDTTYNDGSESAFNYNGYAPSWFTYRIPVSNKVTIKDVQIKTSASEWKSVIDSSKSSAYEFEPAKESTNVNRPLYFYLSPTGKKQVYTYNIKQGVVDGITDGSGNVTTSIYFDNCDGWDESKLCVHAYGPESDGVYKKLSSNSTSYDDNYYVFNFEEGKYCYFQFYEGEEDANGPQSLKDAVNKSKILYFTGEELGTNEDKNRVDYDGWDARTTKLLCKGAATGLSWYMHPRTAVMYAYLDMDTVNNMTSDYAYYGYNPSSGSYTCHGNVSIGCFSTKLSTLSGMYENGNAGGNKWTTKNLSQVGDGLLAAASTFVNTLSEAQVYVSENIEDATRDDWTGDDPDNMVFMEGEQLADSAFEYSDRWKAGLTSVYKSIMKDNYHPVDEYGNVNYSRRVSNSSIYNQNMTSALFTKYEGWMRAWLDNPQYSIKPDAVRIIVDDNKLFGGGGWGQDQLKLWVKDPILNEWKLFTATTYETTQSGFYAFVFMLPSSNDYYRQWFVIAPNAPDIVTEEQVNDDGSITRITVDKIGDQVVKPCQIESGQQYRCNTYYAYSGDKYFTIDSTTETKTYTGNEIVYEDNSPTKLMNEFTGTKPTAPFWVNFKYDTHVVNTSKGLDYWIFAGAYKISKDTYAGFVTDFDATGTLESATKTGIDVYTESARKFFREKGADGYMSYGQKSATGYSNWTGSRSNTGKDIDIMTKKIGGSGSITASEPKNRVNFRYNGEKGKDTLKVDKNIKLKGETVTMAVNRIDFRSAGANDFVLEAGTIVFITDTTIIRPDGKSVLIDRGTYRFDAGDTNKTFYTVSLRTTGDDPDWRNHFTMLGDEGTLLKGGKYVNN